MSYLNFKRPFQKFLPLIIALSGMMLALVQYLQNRSLWLDEAMLALNIIRKSPLSLLKPLDDEQVAPVLFLQIEKLFSHIMEYSEYGLRLFPLICFAVALFLFLRILQNFSTDFLWISLCLLFFSLNANLLYYASEVKQYMTDVFVSVLIPFMVLRDYAKQRQKIMLIGSAGAISLFLSSITPIILFSAGLFLIISNWKEIKSTYFSLLSIFGIWCVFFLGYYFSFVHNHPTKEGMIRFWTQFGGGFPPLNSGYFNFVFSKIYYHFSIYGKLGIVLFGFFIAGISYMIIKKKFNYLILFILPLMLHILLSTLRQYPLNGRLMMYLVPYFLITACLGIQFLVEKIPSKFDLKWPLFGLFSLMLTFQLIRLYPVKSFYQLFPTTKADESKEEKVREALDFVMDHKKENDLIYICSGVGMAFEYYKLKDHLQIKNQVIKGDWFHINDVLETNLNDTPGDIWFLASGLYPIGEKEMLSEFLQKRNKKFLLKEELYPQVSQFQIENQ